MASPACRPDSSTLADPLLSSGWWPDSADLAVELPILVPLLDQVRGPVSRLLLSVVGWASRPHEVSTDGRTISIGYLAGQSPSMLTVLCADGGTFTVRVVPPAVPDHEAEVGNLGRSANWANR